MKNILKFFALAATVAVAAISCNKEAETSTPEGQAKFVIRASVPTTKTAITDNGNGTYSPTWNENDAIGVFFNTVSGSPVEFDNTEKDGDIAIFAPKTTLSVSGDQTLYGFYPYGAFQEVDPTALNCILVNVKEKQTPNSVGSFDKDADILVARPYSNTIEEIVDAGGIIDLQFARLLTVVKVTPTYTEEVAQTITGEYIKSVKIGYDGAEEDEPLTGSVTLNLGNGELSNWTNKSFSVSANYDDNAYAVESGESAYLLVNPISIAAGKNITFTIKTNKHTVLKTVTLENNVAFPAGNIAKISLAVDDTWTVFENSTEAEPYTAAKVYEIVNALHKSVEVEKVYAKGIISGITTAYSSKYNNVSFNISDDGLTTGTQFNVFRIGAESADDFKVGDAVEICGTVKNYNGTTPEYAAGATLVAILHKPVFDPNGGKFDESVSVTITADDGASILYSTGEDAPATAYTAPISITETTTVNAVAKSGILTTGVVSATFTKNTGGGSTEPSLQYTLDGTITGGSSGYAEASSITQNDINWSVTANTTMNPWRFGGKNLTNADRAAYSVDPISSNITKIEVESGTKTVKAVNSLTISVHDSAVDAASGSNAIASKTVTDGIISSTVTLEATDSAWTGKYYRIVYNVSTSSSNQYIQLKEIRFFGFDSK